MIISMLITVVLLVAILLFISVNINIIYIRYINGIKYVVLSIDCDCGYYEKLLSRDELESKVDKTCPVCGKIIFTKNEYDSVIFFESFCEKIRRFERFTIKIDSEGYTKAKLLPFKKEEK